MDFYKKSSAVQYGQVGQREDRHCHLKMTGEPWREQSVGLCPTFSKTDGPGHKPFMTNDTLMGCSGEARGLEKVLPWLPFLLRHIGDPG